jgi:multidrug efflux pump subunit AcrA (membrane-fusion protein)
MPIEARVSRISPFLHPVTRTTTADIDVEQPDSALLPGMFVTVDVLYGESELAALVPNNALYRDPRDGREGVWLAAVDEGTRALETAASAPRRASLDPAGPVHIEFVPMDVIARGRLASAVSGLEPGQWVVTVGHHLLSDDDTDVAVVQPTPWEHIMRLQQVQTRDLIDLVRRKQEELAVDGGSAPAGDAGEAATLD